LLDTKAWPIITRTVLTIPFRKHPKHRAVCLYQRYRLFWLETGQRTSASWGVPRPTPLFQFSNKVSHCHQIQHKITATGIYSNTHLSQFPCFFSFVLVQEPYQGLGPPHCSRAHTHTTFRRSPLNEGSARRVDLYPTGHNKQSQHSTPRQCHQTGGRRPTSCTERPPGSVNTHIYE